MPKYKCNYCGATNLKEINKTEYFCDHCGKTIFIAKDSNIETINAGRSHSKNDNLYKHSGSQLSIFKRWKKMNKEVKANLFAFISLLLIFIVLFIPFFLVPFVVIFWIYSYIFWRKIK